MLLQSLYRDMDMDMVSMETAWHTRMRVSLPLYRPHSGQVVATTTLLNSSSSSSSIPLQPSRINITPKRQARQLRAPLLAALLVARALWLQSAALALVRR